MINSLFTLLSAGLKAQKIETPTEDLDSLFAMCCKQGVQAIVWDAFLSYDRIPRNLKLSWALSVESIKKRYNHQYAIASEVAQILKNNNIKTIILKGIDASLNYPNPEYRPCGDIDCFLGENYELSNQILEKNGAKLYIDHYKHSHIDYKGLRIENHHFCTAIRGSRKQKEFERILQDIINTQPLTPIGDTALLSPSPLFCALFLTYHAQKHFLSEGIALRHLCDWAMFLDKKGSQVDWERFNEITNAFGLKYFADSMTRLSLKLLNIKGYDTENDDVRDEYLKNEILYNQQHIFSKKTSKMQKRYMLINSKMSNVKRYKLFSDQSYFADICNLVFSFFFDRNPKI